MTQQAIARAATAEDVAAIAVLLGASDLPTTDLAESRPELIVIEDGAAIVGAGGLQRYGEVALLRSVVVTKERQNGGLGSTLLGELERHAIARGVRELVLLTQTAERFFARHGYARVERATVPRPIQATSEFRSLCPASAICMSKHLVRRGLTNE